MGKLEQVTAGWKKVQQDVKDSLNSTGSVYAKIKRIVGIFVMVIYRLRGVILGIPVIWHALKLAAYNREHLPEMVGIDLMSNGAFANKLGAAVVSCRRGGATATFDQLNKYFTISNMPVVSGTYWNQVHGNTPDEVKQDLEGMQNMRAIGRNMAWLLKCLEAGKNAGVALPEQEEKIKTNYIR